MIPVSAALVASLAVLAVANVLNNRVAVRWYVVTSMVAAALLLMLFRLAGLDWADAGLGGDALARGALWGLVLVVLVAIGYLVGVRLPALRGAFADRRVERAGVATVGWQILVRIPFGTVALEEIAFRGVLLGLLRDIYGTGWATVASSVLFGLWHVLPSHDLARLNPLAERTFGARQALLVFAAVVTTALAGVIFCELLRRTGSLAAPMALHWATNALGYLAAFAAQRRP